MRVAASVLATLLVVLCTSVLLDLPLIHPPRRISEKVEKRKSPTGESTEKKGHLYIHVGPSKTATTTLQTDLTKFVKVLEKENHYYLGRWYQHDENESLRWYQHDKNESLHQRVQWETLQALEPALDHRHTPCTLSPRSDCLLEFKTKLDESYNSTIAHIQQQQDASKRSATLTFVMSSERLSNCWTSPEDYEAIRDTLSEDWDVTIVVSYRRFYSFIRSSKFQMDRVDRDGGKFGKKRLWPKSGGSHLNGYFNVKNGQLRKFHVFTDTAVENAKKYLPVKMFYPFNYDTASDALINSTESVLTKFLCNILPHANDACSLSREIDANATTKMLNPRTDEDDMLYDTIATKASDADLFNTTHYSRPEVRKAVRRFNEEELQQGIIDLDLDCPSDVQLLSLLEKSLMFEYKYAPDLAKDPRNINKHLADFHALVEKRAFCWVDTDKILERTEWKNFFSSNFAHPPQTKGTDGS